MAERIRYRDRTDHMITFVLISLVIFGLVMVFSVASSQDNLGLFLKQLGAMSIGLLIMYAIHYLKVDYINKWIIFILYILSWITIFMLKLPEPYTHKVNGATRWLNLGIRFQVAEFVKIAVILMLAFWIDHFKDRDNWKQEIAFILIGWGLGVAPAGALMVISNDLSSAMVIAGITFIMVFVGCKGKLGWFMHIFVGMSVVAFVVWYVLKIANNMPTEEAVINYEVQFRVGRIAAWLDPQRYSKSIGFQTLHCLYAIANGGWIGKGLGQSWQKAILPESENDVIFAVIIEELGILGGLLMLFLFGVLLVLMCKVAYNVEDDFYRLIIVGVVSHIMLQVIIHCSVCINLIPNTGIGLPFISSGMTQSLTQLMEMAMVLSIARVHVKELSVKKKKMRKISRDASIRRKSAKKTEQEQSAQEIPEYGKRRRGTQPSGTGRVANGRNRVGVSGSGNIHRFGTTSTGASRTGRRGSGSSANAAGGPLGSRGMSGYSSRSTGAYSGRSTSGYGSRSTSSYSSRSTNAYGDRSTGAYSGSHRVGSGGYRSRYPSPAEYRQARYPSSRHTSSSGYGSEPNSRKESTAGYTRRSSVDRRDSSHGKITPFRPRKQ